jgi:dynein intermediate chain 1
MGRVTQNKQNNVLRLTDKELNEEMPSRMLIPNNPQAAVNIALYDYTERKYRSNELIDQLVIHFSLEGDLIHVSSNEYKAQEDIEEFRKNNFNKFRALAEA